jgi:Mg2+/Co2+ transporter CorB
MILTYKIIGLIVLLFLSAFFSSSETALVSISRLRVRHLLKQRKPGAKILKKLKDDPKRLLITILIGNNLVNVSASALATLVAMDIFESNAVSYAIGIITFMILVFGEITPKTFATYHNKRFSLFVAKPIWFLSVVFYPLVVVFDGITQFLMKIFGWERKKKPVVTEAEIRSIVELGEDIGAIKKAEEALIKNVFRFDDVEVEDIMTPKEKIFSLDAKKKLRDVMPIILKKRYTRIPVYREYPENIMGVISKNDILNCYANRKTDIPLRKIMKHIFFILDKRKIDVLLKQFLSKNIHLAVVMDENHILRGIVTLEDVLEELVGEITDEKEIEHLKLKKKIKE